MKCSLKVNGNYNSATIRDENGDIVIRCGSLKVLRAVGCVGFYPTLTDKAGSRSLDGHLYKNKVDALFAAVYHLIELGWDITDAFTGDHLTLEAINATGWKKTSFEK